MNNAVHDPRLLFRSFMAALLAAVSGTIGWLYPDIPVIIVSLWSAVYMAGVGIGEVWFDRNSTSVPNDSTVVETRTILKENA